MADRDNLIPGCQKLEISTVQQKVPSQEKLTVVASEIFLTRAQPWLQTSGRSGIRAILPLPIFGVVWWLASLQLAPSAIGELIVYAFTNLALLIGIRLTQKQQAYVWSTFLLLCSALSDALLAVFLLNTLGPLTVAIFPLYAVLAIKAFHYRKQFLGMLLVPALLGPFYLSALYLYAQDPSVLGTSQIVAYWGLIAGSFGSVCLLLALSEYRLRQNRRLTQQFDVDRDDYESRVAELESINTDLRVRIRSQQALEESLRAITGSLSLEDVLRQILDSMMQMLGTTRVSAAALTLSNGASFTHQTLALDLTLPTPLVEVLTRHVIQERSPLVVGDALHEREWRELYRCGIASALSVPLIDVDNVVRGSLTVVSTQRHAFTSTEARHLNSFSIQASVAIHNAELHSQLARQRQMLEAVVRDIGDGLIVLDQHGAMVLANPVAYQVLAHSDALDADLRDRLVQLSHAVHSDGSGMVSQELRVGNPDDDQERVYQAFASLVRLSDLEPSYAAIVLHDITDHKAEERTRVEFISMVSHELRNPLNTMNGFLKVVLQGRTGELSELQREFLDLAASQADQLKGRITELLEFNRLEAGRLRLQPNWGNLPELIKTTGARLQFQVEQAGLNLLYNVTTDIPEVLMDSERIGQVVTNLVENAIKATSHGGIIEIGAEVCNTDVHIYVRDTGIGIPHEEQGRIFNRFYRLHHKASHHGAHLGLGLSICQQIVEGHNGRIWVDSEEGKGSKFIFTLPLVNREQMLGRVCAA